MVGEGVELRPAGVRRWLLPKWLVRVDHEGLTYEAPGSEVRVRWQEVRALVPAEVQGGPEVEGERVLALGVVLRRPLAQPVLVDGALPALDYAIPIEGLSEHRWLRGLADWPAAIVERVMDFAGPAGVEMVSPGT